MLGHFMRGFVLAFSGTSRDSLLPPAFIACELQDKPITARDGIRHADGDIDAQVRYLLILNEQPPTHLQKVVGMLKDQLCITPEAIAFWEFQTRPKRATT